MKKTVTLTNLIKAKNDLELFIKIDQIKRLKKLFDPTFDISDLNSKIEEKEDQLIIIKEAIQNANANNNDKEGRSINYSIYLLSKYNRLKSDLNTLKDRLESSELTDNDKIKSSLLKDVQELDDLIKKETDKKKKSDLMSSKSKLKRSISKISLTSKSHISTLTVKIGKQLSDVEEKITALKSKLTTLNDSINVEVDINDGFEIAVK